MFVSHAIRMLGLKSMPGTFIGVRPGVRCMLYVDKHTDHYPTTNGKTFNVSNHG